MADAANDGGGPRPAPTGESDARGEAALLLVESLIHELIARATLSVTSALDVVQTAIDAQLEISDHRGDDPAAAPGAVRLLCAIAASLRVDEPDPVAEPDGGAFRDGPTA